MRPLLVGKPFGSEEKRGYERTDRLERTETEEYDLGSNVKCLVCMLFVQEEM